MHDLISIKKLLHHYCVNGVNQKMETLQMAMMAAKESAHNDSKSSAGDKHETSRAMAQLEQEKLLGQLSEIQKLQQVLTHISPEKTSLIAELGSLIITNKGNYYIAIALGKVNVKNDMYFVISAVSPIGKVLLSTRIGSQVSFQNQQIIVKNIV